MNGLSWKRGLWVSLTALVVLLLVWGAVALGNGAADRHNGDGDRPSGTPSVVDPAAPPTDDAPPVVNCPVRFTQKDITDPKLYRFIKGGIDAKTAAKSSHKLLEAVGHDASSLKFYARTFGIKNLPSEAKMLTPDDSCLSKVGQGVHHDLTVVMNASGVKFGNAPANAYNSGVNKDGLPVIDTAPGVSGNKKAIIVTLPDGSQVIILVRCGNPVFPSPPPGIPEGPTDNQPPTTPPTSPPTTPPTTPPTSPPTTTPGPKDPSEDPAQNGNTDNGGTNGPSSGPNPSPTFPTHQPSNPAPPAPTPTANPSAPPPATGAPDPTEAPSDCAPAPGESCP